MNLYAEYLQERENVFLFVVEEKGFLTYSIDEDENNEKYIYIQDIYVRPQFRKHNIASEMANKVCAESKEKYGVTKLVGSVDVSANGASISMLTLIAYKMKPYMNNGNVVFFNKEL